MLHKDNSTASHQCSVKCNQCSSPLGLFTPVCRRNGLKVPMEIDLMYRVGKQVELSCAFTPTQNQSFESQDWVRLIETQGLLESSGRRTQVLHLNSMCNFVSYTFSTSLAAPKMTFLMWILPPSALVVEIVGYPI